MANYEKMYHIMFNAAQDAQRVAKLFIIRCPCRPAGVFYVLPPAGYFCHQRQKYPKTPLETTFQNFLGALRPAANLPYVPRVIGFSRVPLSVKRTVPPQLTATASLPLPVATAAAFPFTATKGKVASPRLRRGEATFSFLPISFPRQYCRVLFRRRRYSRG